jgi:hypothetical protein
MAMELLKLKYSEEAIREKRAFVAQKLIASSRNIKNGTIKEITIGDLKLLFEIYDEVFFGSWFRNNIKDKLRFSLSRRMTKSAGKTICSRYPKDKAQKIINIEIRIGIDFFFRYGVINKDNNVCGIKTSSGLEAMQIVFEHEMCHVIEFINFMESNCKGERFRIISNNLFAHTQSYHQLPTQKEIVQTRLGIRVGDKVFFNFEEKTLKGIIQGINKRATVMVLDKNGSYVDKVGNKYAKYYVPVNRLRQEVGM